MSTKLNILESDFLYHARTDLDPTDVSHLGPDLLWDEFIMSLAVFVDSMSNDGLFSDAPIADRKDNLVRFIEKDVLELYSAEVRSIGDGKIYVEKTFAGDEDPEVARYSIVDVMCSVGVFDDMASGVFDRAFACFPRINNAAK